MNFCFPGINFTCAKKQQTTEHEDSHGHQNITSRTCSTSASGEKHNKARRYIYTILPKVLAPPSNERFDYFSNLHEYNCFMFKHIMIV